MDSKIYGRHNPKFRIIVLGSKKVGKTSLINQTTNNFFRPEYYPTKDLIIYKKLYNFTPKSGDFDDFCYIELIDTMAYDRSKNLKDVSEFFAIHLLKEKYISKTNMATKIPDSILKSIKHEYFFGKDNTHAKGLFSNDKIMAYLFVFDYNDDESLNEMLELYYSITSDESIKINEDSMTTIKCFICNKYPHIIQEVPSDIPYAEVVKSYMDRDRKITEIVYKIQKRLIYKDQKKIPDAKEITYFTNTKYNLGINNCFDSVFNKIKQKEDLWKKITYENKEENEDKDKEENDNKEEDAATTGYLCCKKAKPKLDNNGLEDKSLQNQSIGEKLNFKDEEDEAGYDNNIRVKPKQENAPAESEEKASGCLIY